MEEQEQPRDAVDPTSDEPADGEAVEPEREDRVQDDEAGELADAPAAGVIDDDDPDPPEPSEPG